MHRIALLTAVCGLLSACCAPEVCDGDGDGWCVVDGDCDDSDAWTHPEAQEVCDGVDNDCDGAHLRESGEQDSDGDGWPDCDDCEPMEATIRGPIAEVCPGA